MNYTEYVTLLRDAIREASQQAAADQITQMSKANFRQLVHFPLAVVNMNMAERAFEAALHAELQVLHTERGCYVTIR